MRRLTHTLAGLYALLAFGLLRCAMVSQQAGRWDYTAFFSACAVGFATAISHHSWQRDELRAALARLERGARPTDQQPAIDGVVSVAMASWCCDTAVITAGAEHDPEHCTRKDQTT